MRRNPFDQKEEPVIIPAAVKKRKAAMKKFMESPFYKEFLNLMEDRKNIFKQPLPNTPEAEYQYNRGNQICDVIDMVIQFIEEDAATEEGERQ